MGLLRKSGVTKLEIAWTVERNGRGWSFDMNKTGDDLPPALKVALVNNLLGSLNPSEYVFDVRDV